jgi:hypothetical protein
MSEPCAAAGPTRTWEAADPSANPVDRDGTVLVIGTRKGLWLLAADRARSRWSVAGPMFLGHIVNHAALDPRDGRSLVAGISTGHLGPTVFRSHDLGRTWYEASKPPAFPTGERLGRSVKSVFWLTPGHASQPGVWYAGASPQALFRSEDGGDTWEPVSGWNDHPMWET